MNIFNDHWPNLNCYVNVVQDDEGEGEDDHEDPLVIDEAEERSEGADSDEKVFISWQSKIYDQYYKHWPMSSMFCST